MSRKRILSDSKRESIIGLKTGFLAGKTLSQIENYIQNNVTDLSSAKNVMKLMAKAIFYLAKQQGILK